MKITACYIVKNEEGNLKTSISTLEGQVDEILVVDTGSEDGTKDVAASCGARILDFPWREDFAAARNFALDHVTEGWVVFLDADEYFSEGTAGNLRRVVEEEDARGRDLLILPLQNIDRETGEILLDSHVPRIFRSSPALRYHGRIHEELREGGAPVKGFRVLSPEELLLIHTGYSRCISKAKARRNVELLLGELERGEAPGNLYMYLAEAYDGLEDRANAMKYARLDVEQGRRSIVYASRSWRILLRHLSRDPKDQESRREFAAKAAGDFPELPEFRGEYAECLAAAKDFAGAVREAEAAEKAYLGYDRKTSLEPMMFSEDMLVTLRGRCREWERLETRAENISLSSCLILRNGREDMASWLSNTAVFSHERIVIDTGSEDGSQEMAKAAGCRVYESTWQGDFSEARNQAIERATGEWIAFLDADEAFQRPEELRPYLAWLESSHPEAEAVLVPLVNVDRDEGDRVISHDRVLRLFRNRPDLRYRGRVHETLGRADGTLPCAYQEGRMLTLLHWGYSSERIRAKARRNLELLEADMAEGGEGDRHYRYLADCCSTLGDWEKAAHYARKAMMSPLQSVVPDSRMEHLLLVAMGKTDAPFWEQERFAREMVKKFPQKPDFHGILGVLLAEQGRREEAVPFLERALELEKTTEAEGIPSDFSGTAGPACAWLALFRAEEGRTWESLLERAMDASCREDDVLNAARGIREDMAPEEFSHWLLKWFPREKGSLVYLARWAERNGQADLLGYWRKILEEDFGRILPREDFYGEQPPGDSELCGLLLQDLRLLLQVMFQLEGEGAEDWNALEGQCADLLPPSARGAWDAYRGRRKEAPEDGFRFLWPILLDTGDASQMKRFAALSLALPGDAWRLVARELLAREAWEAALALYGRIPADSPAADGEFWHDVGVCLWHMRDRAAAECFERARGMGHTARDMEAYEAWMREWQA